ncbi:hypothetical protein PanWU01x14_050380 [Parasponia andersonii]|uniref:Uncharacterized protein n=1 Tax=Parasponia andersonii TaxID=3476 RepID=A0A2P5DLP5_PARAD|nr:hypothetical protein PanWU01x14_050380 [Parasponia andersonii]
MLRIPSLILIRNTVNGDPHCVGVVLTFLILCLWNLEQLFITQQVEGSQSFRITVHRFVDV